MTREGEKVLAFLDAGILISIKVNLLSEERVRRWEARESDIELGYSNKKYFSIIGRKISRIDLDKIESCKMAIGEMWYQPVAIAC